MTGFLSHLKQPNVALVLIFGTLLSFLSGWQIAQSNQRAIKQATQLQLHDLSEHINRLLTHYYYGLMGLRGAIVTVGLEHLDRQTFRQYSETMEISEKFPGARGFGLIRRVGVAEHEQFVQRARADGFADFNIYSLTPHEQERYVIQFIEPFETNAQAIGLDIASEVNRRMAAQASMHSGKAVLTGPISLVQANGEPLQSFLLLLPLVQPAHIAADQPKEVVGWVYTALQINKIVAVLAVNQQVFQVSLSDVTDEQSPVTFYTSSSETVQREADDQLRWPEFGRQWQLSMYVSPGFVQTLNLTSSWFTALIGLIVTVLIALITVMLNSLKHKQQQIAEEQARLATIVKNSDDAIVSQTLDGIVTSWNDGACRMFGFLPEEIIGRCLRDFIVPPELQHEELLMFSEITQGRMVSHIETKRLHKNGKSIDVSVNISPMLDANKMINGVSKTLRDITQQKKHQARVLELNSSLESQIKQRTKELSETNVLLRNLLNSAVEVAIIATDLDGTIQIFNRGAEIMLGYSAEELIGVHNLSIVHLGDEILLRSRELSAEYGEQIAGFDVFTIKLNRIGSETREWTYVKCDGKHITVSLMTTSIKDEQGLTTGYLGIAIDQSKRKAVEQALASSLENTRAILDTATNPIITIDLQGIIHSVNPAGTREFGYRADELVGQNVKLLMPEPYHSQHDGYLERYSQGGEAKIIGLGREVEAKRKDGSRLPVHLSVGEMQLAGERRFVGLMTNITGLREKQEELESAHQQIKLANEIAELGVWIWTLADNSLQWNERMFALYDWPQTLRESGLTINHWRERVHPEDIEDLEHQLFNAVAGKGKYEPIFRVVHTNGDILHLQGAAQTERDATGKVVRLVGINRDITAQVNIETTLQDAKDKADAASAAKSAFLANMSHEIRTPMNAVLGMLQLVQKSGLSDYQRDYIDKAYSAANSLLGLLNDILDYSKIEANKLELDNHQFNLEELMQKLAIVLSGNKNIGEVEIVLNLPMSLPLNLVGDAFRLQQILINLAGNALKFTQQGQVIVSVSESGRQENKVKLRFSVADSGIGISAQQRGKIFDGFTQAEASTTRRFGGTGLGLVICKRLLGLMEAKLELFSELGKGSEFWFEVWLDCVDQQQIADQYARMSFAQNVVICCTNTWVNQSLHRMLQHLGWQVSSIADNSNDAVLQSVQVLLERSAGIALVILEMSPDCLDIAKDIQRFAAFKGQAKPAIMLMAGQHQLSNIADINGAGGKSVFDAILTKPLTVRQLVQKIAVLFSPLSEADAPADSAVSLKLADQHILVVDDNEINRVVACQLLSSVGAMVDEAEGGNSGVEKVLNSHPTAPYNVVLMDMQMPDIDGLEATRRIRADRRFRDLPIIAMTANVSESDKQQCLQAGMNSHIGKPFQLDDLVSVILSQIAERQKSSQDSDGQG